MLFARRLMTQDDQGDISEDFEGVVVPRSAKVAIPFDESRPVDRRRLIKIRAVKELKAAGFTVAEIAAAVELSERHVKRHSATVRELAEAFGRA
jgi:transcriptional regulator GlxA family with amidase domain